MFFFFFCKQKTAYEMRISDWSSDVCSSDLGCPHLDIAACDAQFGLLAQIAAARRQGQRGRGKGGGGEGLDHGTLPIWPSTQVTDKPPKPLCQAAAHLYRAQKPDRKSTRLHSSP